MQIALHLGAHCTDDDKLLRSLLKNRASLSEQGIVVPGPSKYRAAVRDTLNTLKGRAASTETQEAILDAIIDEEIADRVILSNQNFICVPPRAVGDGRLYPKAEYKVKWMRQLFQDHDVEYHMAIRNPATFLPAVYAETKSPSFEAFLDSTDPRNFRWSELFERIHTVNPDARFTVWCNEDTPLLWGQILREIAGCDPLTAMDGAHDIAEQIMSEDGVKRLRGYVAQHPPQTEVQRRRILAAFLEKFALEDELDFEIELPDWDAALLDEVTAAYDADIAEISQVPGVTVITP